jgi:hypothetical protein
MKKFDSVLGSTNDDDTMMALLDCVRVSMKQYYPSIKTIEDVEDSMDLATMYTILDIGGGIKLGPRAKEDIEKAQPNKENLSKDNSDNSWDKLDLAKIESEVFLLGTWKDYEELESCLSMPELTATLNLKREVDYQDKKFLAAMQGVDLDEQSGKKEENAWEKMKAKHMSRGKTSDPNDILSFQGAKAQQNGFGIGMGLDYETM